jgi:hypothetical protein
MDIMTPSNEKTREGKEKKINQFLLWFRIFNCLRAIATAIYSYVVTVQGLTNDGMIKLGSRNLLITSLVTTTVDLFVPLVRLFPQILWCFWDVNTWDPFAKTWTVWALVADHDLLIDIFPILLNVIIKVYIYRVSELISNPNIQDTVVLPHSILDYESIYSNRVLE